MGRVKEFYYKALEESFIWDFGYEEYLREQQEAREFDIEQMEQEFIKSSSFIKLINRSIANNPNYDNPKGA